MAWKTKDLREMAAAAIRAAFNARRLIRGTIGDPFRDRDGPMRFWGCSMGVIREEAAQRGLLQKPADRYSESRVGRVLGLTEGEVKRIIESNDHSKGIRHTLFTEEGEPNEVSLIACTDDLEKILQTLYEIPTRAEVDVQSLSSEANALAERAVLVPRVETENLEGLIARLSEPMANRQAAEKVETECERALALAIEVEQAETKREEALV